MARPFHHLAQFNIARMLGDIGSPIMAGFASQIDTMNAAAERSPGFVWRLRTAPGDNAGAFSDPRMLVNLTVWDTIETLKDFTYRGIHKGPVRDRAQWFERPSQAHLVLWWIPAGHIPSTQEAVERLDYLRGHGPQPCAFTFAKPFPPPASPRETDAAPPVDLDNKAFFTQSNSPNGDAANGTQFFYRQQGSRVWATYRGGGVRFGGLVAVWNHEGQLEMRYQHAATDGAYRTGRCTSTPSVSSDGRIVLEEEWQWTNGDSTSGRSTLIEIAA